MTVSDIAEALDARRAGAGWVCRCVLADEHTHGDADPSLSLSERDGRILVHCQSRHADEQGRVIAVLKARGLWPDRAERRRQERQGLKRKSNTQSSSIHVRRDGDDEFEYVALVPDGIEKSHIAARRLYPSLCRQFGSAHFFPYRDQQGAPQLMVFRFEQTGSGDTDKKKKEIRPLSGWCNRKTGDLVWRPWWPPLPLPLFGLEKLARNPDAPALLFGGELKCERAAELTTDFVTLSLPGGDHAIDKVDLNPLASRRVIAWPDHDQSCFDTMIKVARKVEAMQIARNGVISQSAQIVKPDAAGWTRHRQPD